MIEQRLEELDLSLPEPPEPVAAYVPAVQSDSLVFTSGQSCIVDGEFVYQGRVGEDLTLEEGYEAARLTGLVCLSVIKQKIGDLDRVERVVKLFGLVNSTDDFTEQPSVINGASELLLDVFGDAGQHARSAVGTNVLPFNLPVEIEMIVEVT